MAAAICLGGGHTFLKRRSNPIIHGELLVTSKGAVRTYGMATTPNELPDDLATAQELIHELAQTVHAQEHLIAKLQHQLEQLLRPRYGRKSEKLDPAQLWLFARQILTALGTEPAATQPAAGESAAAESAPPEQPRRAGGEPDPEERARPQAPAGRLAAQTGPP